MATEVMPRLNAAIADERAEPRAAQA
jgi:hypothetical protein